MIFVINSVLNIVSLLQYVLNHSSKIALKYYNQVREKSDVISSCRTCLINLH